MKIDLAVIGHGAVTPAGVGSESLFLSKPKADLISPLNSSGEELPAFRVDLQQSAFARWQREPRLRRVSPISYFLVEAAEQALSGISLAQRQRTGLIVAFCAGCLSYSRRFFEAIIKQGKKAASPMLFPETVFNSPVSHVASILGLEGSAYALVGDETAWIAALKTASVWLQRGRVDHVLVLGAEEFDPAVLDAYRSAGWMGSRATNGFIPSEGAAGVLVTRAKPNDFRMISEAWDGFLYTSSRDAVQAAERCLQATSSPSHCYRTAQHNWFHSIEEKLILDGAFLKQDEYPYLGEAFTASAAWNTIRALHCLNDRQSNILIPVWGLNHQLGALMLRNC